MRARIVAAATLLFAATLAQASPSGTPQANAPRDGKGTAVDLPFFRHHSAPPPTAASVGGGKVLGKATPVEPRRHLTQAEWRKAFIAKHGHDLQAPAHPGH